jgi:(1->4)-alpha-D-glucan 1-alpha-D-glucosylmutase
LPKLWLIRKTLDFRRRHPERFGADSSYEPLTARGSKATHAVAFKRGDAVVTVAPRLIIGLAGDWADTVLGLPSGNWRNELAGYAIGAEPCRLADLLRPFPVALLSRMEKN